MAGKSSTKPKPKQVEVKNPKDDEPKYEKIPTLKEMAVVFLITSVFAAIAALLVAATQDGLVKFGKSFTASQLPTYSSCLTVSFPVQELPSDHLSLPDFFPNAADFLSPFASPASLTFGQYQGQALRSSQELSSSEELKLSRVS